MIASWRLLPPKLTPTRGKTCLADAGEHALAELRIDRTRELEIGCAPGQEVAEPAFERPREDDGEAAIDVDVVGRQEDGCFRAASLEAATQLRHGRPRLAR